MLGWSFGFGVWEVKTRAENKGKAKKAYGN